VIQTNHDAITYISVTFPRPAFQQAAGSIEYFATSVGIGRTLYGPPSLLVLLDQRYENIERVTAPNDHQNEPTMLVNPNASILCVGKIANMAEASCQNLKNKRCSIRVTELLRYKRILLTNGTHNATFGPGIVRRKLVLLPDHFVVLRQCGDLALWHHVHHLEAARLELTD